MATKRINYADIKTRVCPICGGSVDINFEEATAECQYCGRFFDVAMSDEIRKEYIRTKANREREEKRRAFEYEKAQQRREEYEAIHFTKTKAGKLAVVMAVFCGLMASSSAQQGWRIVSIIALVQTCIFIYVVVRGKKIIDIGGSFNYRRWLAAGLILMIPAFIFAGIEMGVELGDKNEDINWEDYELAKKIPPIEGSKRVDIEEEDGSLTLKVSYFDDDEYNDYIRKFKKRGYVVDKRREYDWTYSAYNSEGYKIDLDKMDGSVEELDIVITEPIKFGEYDWPTKGPASNITPVMGDGTKVETDDSNHYEAYYHGVTKKKFNKYVKKYKEEGFDDDYSKDEYSFKANNTGLFSGTTELEMEYVGFKTIHIDVYQEE